MILLRTLFTMVSATAFLLPRMPAGRLLMASAIPLFTISSRRPTSPNGDIGLAASASISGISASNVEHCAAIALCKRIREHLHALGWPDPISADSGNGAHLIYRVDLPVDDAGLVQKCLAALAARFNDDAVKVDQT